MLESKKQCSIKKIETEAKSTKFLSGLAHEFKTPLSGILSSISLIEKYIESSQIEKTTKHIKNIKNEVDQMDTAIDEYITLEKVFHEDVKYKPQHFNIGILLNEVLKKLDMTLKGDQKITYFESLHDGLVFHDYKLIQYILRTVFEKIAKDVSHKSTISILAKEKTSSILFCITNNKEQDSKQKMERILIDLDSKQVVNENEDVVGLILIQNHIKTLNGTFNYIDNGKENVVLSIELPKKHTL